MAQGNASKKIMVLNRLVLGSSITPLQALEDFGCFRLASAIHDLREDGWIISTNTGRSKTSHFAVYSLDMIKNKNRIKTYIKQLEKKAKS